MIAPLTAAAPRATAPLTALRPAAPLDTLAAAPAPTGLPSARQIQAAATPPAEDPRDRVINAANPGQPLDVTSQLVPGKLNLVEFYSPNCPHCTEMAPRLQQLVDKNPDVVVLRVDINRPDAKGIDWQSPLVQQYKLGSVPAFQVYQSDGSLVANDDAQHQASGIVFALLKQAGIQ